MAIKRRSLESYEGDPLIPIMNLVCMLIPLLLYGAVFMRFMTLAENVQCASGAAGTKRKAQSDSHDNRSRIHL
jgi:hypothetical protein